MNAIPANVSGRAEGQVSVTAAVHHAPQGESLTSCTLSSLRRWRWSLTAFKI